MTFDGFPQRMKFTPIPNLFFSQVLPQIQDLAELKTVLHIFWLMYQKKGYPRFVSFRELLGDQTLLAGIKGAGSAAEILHNGLEAAVNRGTLIKLALEGDGGIEELG